MTDALRITVDLDCPADHAFTVWTARIGTWWPADHTTSGRGRMVLEQHAGGRIYERTPEGGERDCGQVLQWEPPERLVYLWHIGRDRNDATEVEVRFVARDAASSTVEIEHRGWERLGDAGAARREQNSAGWDAVLAHFRTAVHDRERGPG
jgi:uncharacterized protein YndB with AHSA1/START domain